MFRCKNNYELFQKAMNLLYKNQEKRNDPIVVYYGTENFMNQEKTIYGEPYGDFRCRQPMYFNLIKKRNMKRFKVTGEDEEDLKFKELSHDNEKEKITYPKKK